MPQNKTTPLQTLYEGLAGKNPQLKERGFDAFQSDMQSEDNLRKLFDGMTVKNPQLKQYGFDAFKTDMFPEPVVESTPEMEEAQKKFTQNPRALMGMDVDTAKQVVSNSIDTPVKDSSGLEGLGTEIGKRAQRGALELNKMLANTPDFLNRLAVEAWNTSPPGKAVEKVGEMLGKNWKLEAMNLKPKKYNQYNQVQKELLTKKIAELNPKHEQGIIESAQKGDWTTFTRNLAGGVADSFAPSVAMMVSGGSMGTAGMISSSAAVFGAGNYLEMDENAPQMDESTKVLAALSKGALEGIFETYLGSGAVGGALRKVITKEGKEAGQNILMNGLRKGFSDLLTKYPALAPMGEGFEEWGTQVTQNYVDILSGYRPDISIFDASGDALVLGIASGMAHSAPLYAAKAIVGSGEEQSPTASNPEQPTPTVDPQQQVDAVRNQFMQESEQQADLFQHENGSFIQVTDKSGKQYFVTKGELESADGLLFAINEEGKEVQLSNTDIAQSEVIPGREAYITQRLEAFEAQLQQVQNNSVTIEGQRYLVHGEVVPGEIALQPIDELGNPTSDNITSLPAEEFANLTQDNVNEVAETTPPETETGGVSEQPTQKIVSTVQIGKNNYKYTNEEDGSFAIQLEEGQDPVKAEKEIRATLPDDQQNRIQLVQDQVTIPASVPWQKPTTQTVTKGIIILPETIQEQNTNELTGSVNNSESQEQKLAGAETPHADNEMVDISETDESLQKEIPTNESDLQINNTVQDENTNEQTASYDLQEGQPIVNEEIGTPVVNETLPVDKSNEVNTESGANGSVVELNEQTEASEPDYNQKKNIVLDYFGGMYADVVESNPQYIYENVPEVNDREAEQIYNEIKSEFEAEKQKTSNNPLFKTPLEQKLDEAKPIVEEKQSVKQAEKEVNTNPTEGQKKAGNYKKGHATFGGFNITIENPVGSTRSGKDAKGKKWSITMNNNYGYFKRTLGKDGDQVDFFLGPNNRSQNVYVVDQVDPNTFLFDEHKVMLGFNSEDEAREAYLSNYEEGWQGLGAITEMHKNDFKKWLNVSGKKKRGKRKPVSELVQVKRKTKKNSLTPEQVQERKENRAKALNIEPVSLEQLILQYIVQGNRLNWGEIQKEVFPSSRSEMNRRIWMLKSDAPTIDELLVKQGIVSGTTFENEAHETNVFRNAVLDVVLSNTTQNDMVNRILEIGSNEETDIEAQENALGEAMAAAEKAEIDFANSVWDEYYDQLIKNEEFPSDNELNNLFLLDNGTEESNTEQGAVQGENEQDSSTESPGGRQVVEGGSSRNATQATPEEVNPNQEKIDKAQTELKTLQSRLKKKEAEINSRNGIFGDTASKPGGLFVDEQFDMANAQQVVEGIKAEITKKEQEIEQLTKAGETAAIENSGQQEISTERKIKSWDDRWAELKAENNPEELDKFYNKVKVALNGYAQGKGEDVVKEFESLKKEIEDYAESIKTESNKEVAEKQDITPVVKEYLTTESNKNQEKTTGVVDRTTYKPYSKEKYPFLSDQEINMMNDIRQKGGKTEGYNRDEVQTVYDKIKAYQSAQSKRYTSGQYHDAKEWVDDLVKQGYLFKGPKTFIHPQNKEEYIFGPKQQVEKDYAKYFAPKYEGAQQNQETFKTPLEKKLEEAEKKQLVPESFSVKTFATFSNNLNNGKIGIEDFKKAFKVLQSSKESIIAELKKHTKPQLLKLMGTYGAYQYKNEKKDRVINAIYNDYLMDFAFGTISYGMGTTMEETIAQKVEKATQEDIDKHVAEYQEQKAKYQEQLEKYKKALENPETLEEFGIFIRKNGIDKLSSEQKAAYDELVTDRVLEQRSEDAEKGAVVEKVELEDVQMSMVETKHTQKGHDLFVVRLSDRLPKEQYQELNTKAKQLGGYYSSYAKGGAIPGFQFKSKEQAEKFMGITEQDASNLDIKEAKQEVKTEKKISKLRDNANKIIENVEEQLSQSRLTNTARRAAQAASTEARLNEEKRIAQTMLNIADAIENGDVKLLDGVKAKTHIELLDALVWRARYTEIAERYPNENYDQRESRKQEPATVETIDYLKKGLFPSIWADNLKQIVWKAADIKGNKRLADKWNKRLARLGKDDTYQTQNDTEVGEISQLFNALPESERKYNMIGDILTNYRRLKTMGIENDSMLRSALREYVQYRGGFIKADKVKELERKLAGRAKHVGVDFFPTPHSVAERMVHEAGIEKNMDVLEPSAGSGNIADAIKETGVIPDVIEISSELSELLTAKGYDVVADDFMQYNDKEYDRIVMNPPFQKGMDGDHVQHAYELLKPNGKLVAIVGEGTFIRSDKKATAFRDWLEEVGGWSRELDKGTFADKTLLNTTQANARLVVIEKSGEWEDQPTSEKEEKPEENEELILEAQEAPKETLQDFGEKIGGARKDMGITRRTRKKTNQPGWRKKYNYANIDGTMAITGSIDTSKPFIVNYTKTTKRYGQKFERLIGLTEIEDGYISRTPKIFSSEQEAEAYIPIYEAHRQGYKIAKKENGYTIYKRASTGKALEFDTFPTREEAETYLNSTEGATSLLNRKRETFSIPSLERVQRTGKDWRNGKDISAEEFTKTFGFRGGEFGKWVKPEERQVLLNLAHDSFMDLSEILNISPKAISLNGELSIAFGARGTGSLEGGFAAHYEGNRAVINMTRLKGAGSLAHEWMHSLDNYFGLQDAKKDYARDENGELVNKDYFFSEVKTYKHGMREELRSLFNNILDNLQKKTVTRQIGVNISQEQYDKVEKRIKIEAEALKVKLERGTTKYKYNRKTKQRDEIVVKATPEQLQQANTIIDKLVSGNTTQPEWKAIGNSPLGDHSYINEDLRELDTIYKSVFGGSGLKRNGYGFYNLGYFTNQLMIAKNKLDRAKAGENETVKIPTDYLENSKLYDGARVSPYYQKQIEMLARAFEQYVVSELEAKGIKSDYLQYDKSPVYKEMYGNSPYPEGEEKTIFNKLFKKFFDTVQEKTDEAGNVAMFRIDDQLKQNLTSADLDKRHAANVELIDHINQLTGNVAETKVVKTVSDLYNDLRAEGVSEKALERLQKEVEQAGERVINGLFFRDKVWIVSENHGKQRNILNTWLHEMTHRIVDGEFTKEELDEIYDSLGKEFIEDNIPNIHHNDPKDKQVHELLAYSYETGANSIESVFNGEVDFEHFPLTLQFATNRITERFKEYGFRETENTKPTGRGTDALQRNSEQESSGQLREDREGEPGTTAAGRTGESQRNVNPLSPDAPNVGQDSSPQVGSEQPSFSKPNRKDYPLLPDYLDALNEFRLKTKSTNLPQTETPEFKKWFGNSQVVDENGKPLVVYHATQADFDTFSKQMFGSSIDTGTNGEGFYFTADPENASTYAKNLHTNTGKLWGESIMPVFLSIQNPVDTPLLLSSGNSKTKSKQLTEKFKKKGFDGIIAEGYGLKWFVAFEPNQIKSATGNNGDFDPDNPDIRFSTSEKTGSNFLDDVLPKAAQRYEDREKVKDFKKTLEYIREFWQDINLPIRRLEEEVIKRGGKLYNKAKPYRDINLSFGRMEELYRQFTEQDMTPILEAVRDLVKSGKDNSYILPYIISKHAVERNREMRMAEFDAWIDANEEATPEERAQKLENLGKKDYSGVRGFDPENKYDNPDQLAEEIVEEFELNADKKLIDNLWEKIGNATGQILEHWRKGGQISEKQYNKYKAQYKYFVPLRGWRHGAAKQLRYSKGEGFGASLRHAEGRKSLADNPLAYMQAVAFKSIGERVTNEINQSLLNLVMTNYDREKFSDLYSVKKIYYVKGEQYNPETGETDEVWDPTLVKPTAEQFAAGEAKTEYYKEHMKLRSHFEGFQHEVIVHREDGDVAIVFSDDQLGTAQAFNRQNTLYELRGKIYDATDLSRVARVTGGFGLTNFMKGMFTSLNPVFPFTNAFRDVPEAAFTLWIQDGNGKVPKNVPVAFNTVRKRLWGKEKGTSDLDKKLQDFYEVGGPTGFTHEKGPEEIEKDLKKELKRILQADGFKGKTVNKVLDVFITIQKWNQLFEDTTRFAVYLSSLEAGKSKEDAAMDAKEASVNFNRKGKGTKLLDSFWAFFNPAIQAAQKNFKLAKDQPKRFAQVAGSVAVLGFMEAMLNDLGDGDDDEYYDMNEYVRQNYAVIGFGEKYLRIPLPQFWRGFHSLGVISYDLFRKQITGKERKTTLGKAGANTMLNFIGGLSPIDIPGFWVDGEFSISPMVPTWAKPVYEVNVTNRDFMHNTIAKEPFTKALEEQLAESSLHKKNVNPAVKAITDFLAKDVGGRYGDLKVDVKDGKIKKLNWWLDWNPSKIEHLFTSYFGGAGRVASDFTTTLLQLAMREEEVDFNNVPFVNSFIRNTPDNKWGIINEWYELKDLSTDFNAVRNYAKRTRDIEKYKDVSESELMVISKIVKAYDDSITKVVKAYGMDSEEGSEKVIGLMEDAMELIDETIKE